MLKIKKENYQKRKENLFPIYTGDNNIINKFDINKL